jgi:hypothetical protein
MRWLFSTDASVIQLVLRWTLAIVMFPYGAQKALGWFGGHGFKGTMGYFKQSFPAPLGLLAILAEFLGPIGLAVGLLSPGGGVRDRLCHGGGGADDSHAARVIHELDRQTEG